MVNINALILIIVFMSQSVFASDFEWRVDNPFPLFNSAEDVRRLLPRPAESIEAYYERYTDPSNGLVTQLDSSAWDRSSRVYRDKYFWPTSHAVRIRWLSGRAGERCQWQVSGGAGRVEGDCGREVSLDIPYKLASNVDNKGVPQVVSVYSDNGATYQESISIQEIVVIGFGDSYASGEGNPDRPMNWRSVPVHVEPKKYSQYSDESNDWFVGHSSSDVSDYADWWDSQCHRSLYSYQTISALRKAAESPHVVVRFASFSCSGAEINDGLLGRQKNPPGFKSDNNAHPNYETSGGQVDQAERSLCAGKIVNKVCLGGLRKIDKVLISIGGNDAGFGGAVAWAMLPYGYNRNYFYIDGKVKQAIINSISGKADVVCPNKTIWQNRCHVNKVTYAEDRINGLSSLYDDLGRVLGSRLAVKGDSIVVNNLPNPTTAGGKLCGSTSDRASNYGFKTFLLTKIYGKKWARFGQYNRWVISIDNDDQPGKDNEQQLLVDNLLNPLNKAIGEAAKNKNWTVVNLDEVGFPAHGWCGDPEPLSCGLNKDGYKTNLSSSFPRFCSGEAAQDWMPYHPSEWKPYAVRDRWIRTFNDSILTQYSLRLDDLISGAFHPTAEAHAHIADQVLRQWSVTDQ